MTIHHLHAQRVDPYPDGADELLLNAFEAHQQQTPEERVFALLDMSLAPRSDRLIAFVKHHGGTSLYEGLYDGEGIDSAAPYILELPETSVERGAMVKSLLGATVGTALLSFIGANRSINSLTKFLQASQEAEIADGTRFMLRTADTRCLPAWKEVLHPEQWQKLVTGISRWWYFDRAGALQVIEGQSGTADAEHAPFRLDSAQAEQLERIAVPDQLLHQVGLHADRLGVLQYSPSAAHAILKSAVVGMPSEEKPTPAALYRVAIGALFDANGFAAVAV